MNNDEKKQHQPMMREVAQNALSVSSVVIVRARVDRGFPIVFISDNIKRYGYSAEEIMRNQTPCIQFVHPDDLERLNQEFRAYLQAKVTEYVREYRFMTTSGEVRWVEERLTIEWDEESGRATHCQGIQIDITERKRTEQELEQSLKAARIHANRLQALNQLTGKLISLSKEQDEQDVFRVLKQHLNMVIDADRLSVGLPDSDNQSIEIALLDDEVGIIRTGMMFPIDDSALGRVFTTGEVAFINNHAEVDNVRAQRLSEAGWKTSIFVPLKFGDRSLGTLNVLSKTPYNYSMDDVQLLQQIAVPVAATLANQALATEVRLIQDIVSRGSSVVIQWAPEEKLPVQYVTENIHQFGYTAEQLMSGEISYISIVHPDEQDEPESFIEFWENFDGDEYVDRYRLVSPEGRIHWVEDRTTVARDKDGKLTHLQSLLLDITPDKLLEEKLRLANTVIENSLAILLRWYPTEGYPIDFVTENIDQFGYAADQLSSGKLRYAEIVHPDDLDWQTQEIERQIETGIDEFTLVYRIMTKSRHVRWVEDRTTIERDADGEITHLQGMILDITDRKVAEDKLTLTQNAVDSAADMIMWMKPDGYFTYVNESAYRAFGYTSEAALLNKPIFDVIPESEQSPYRWQALWDEGMEKGVLQFESFLKSHPDRDDLFPVDVTLDYRQVEEYGYVFAFCRDITKQREAAKALQASEQQLRLMLDDLPNAVSMAELDGSFVYINQAYSDLLRIAPDMIDTINARDLYETPSDRDTLLQLLIRDGIVRGWETEIIRSDGSQFAASLSSQLFLYHGKTVALTSAFDLTERIEAEKVLMKARDVAESANAKLKRSEMMIRSVLDQIPIFTALTRFNGSIIYINNAGDAMFGGLTGERRRSIMSFYKDPNDRERLLVQLIEDGVASELLCDMLYTDGREFHAKVSSRLIEYDGEEVLLTCIFDLTEQIEHEETLKRARDAAEAANEAKSDFLASMSHELRTPLNGILGYTQLLQRDPTLNQNHKDDVHTIHESGKHLLMLINDILDISKIEARKLELHEGSIHTHSFLQGVVNIIQMKAMEKHLEFNVEFVGDLPIGFVADAMRVRQILFNLLGNAIKFTLRGGVAFRVQVATKESKESKESNVQYLHFIVEDSGVGIEPKKLEVIFDPFVQAGDKMSRIAGTGLGLAISQRLARKMGGQISVNSVVGEGSVFCFELPLKATDDVYLHPERLTEKINRYINVQKTVLVVDDNPINRAVLRDWLTAHRFTVVEAENGQEAVELAPSILPDLVITDLIMPELNGYELVQRIRAGKVDWDVSVPIIAMSASASADMCAKTLEVGCNEFFSKPVQMDQLLDCISDLLQLEWIESETPPAIEAFGLNGNVFLKPDILFPDGHNLDLLIEMVEIGDMMGVVTCANQLAADDSKLSVFAQAVQRLADDFEDEKLLQLLQNGKTSD